MPGALAEFLPDDDRIGGGVGTELRSTRLEVARRGERDGDSGLLVTEVDVRLGLALRRLTAPLQAPAGRRGQAQQRVPSAASARPH